MAQQNWLPIAAASALAILSYRYKEGQHQSLFTTTRTTLQSKPYQGKTLAVIPAHTKLTATDYEAAHYYVNYAGTEGWVPKVDIAAAPRHYAHVELDVPYLNQYSPLDAPFGCEGASLLMALRYKGYTDVSLKRMLDDMPKAERDPQKGFVGTPYYKMSGYYQTIFPKPLAAYARKQYSRCVVDISGAPLKALQRELINGHPVVVWGTLRFATPRYEMFDLGKKKPTTVVSNLHVVLLTGYDSVKEAYRVHDPADERQMYWVPKQQFEDAYYTNKYAIAVR